MAPPKIITLFFIVLASAGLYHNASYFSRSSLVAPQQFVPISPPELQGSYNQLSTSTNAQQQNVFQVQSTYIPPPASLPVQHQVTSKIQPPPPPPSKVTSQALSIEIEQKPVNVITPPLKITKRAQEFLPEYQPCCDTRAKHKKPGTPDGDAQILKEDQFLANHALKYPYPIFSGVHKCFNNAEAYTAGWLAKKSMLVGVKFEVVKYFEKYDKDSLYGYPVKWGKAVNMEAVTHSLLGPLINKVGVGAYKTLDALDFSIEHLSLYERRLGLMSMTGDLKDRTVKAIVDNLADRERKVNREALKGNSKLTKLAKEYTDRTIVLMPFYGVAVGTGHSVVSTRFAYLNLTFWSHYRVFPHIGVVVGTEADLAFVKTCGVPWAEIVNVIGQIDMPKNMGVASGVAAAQKFREKGSDWDNKYDYMLWTESDQVLLIRDQAVEALYDLVKDGKHLVVPHRLLPFPRSEDFDPSLAHLLKTAGGNKKELADNDEKVQHAVVADSVRGDRPMETASCCFDPGDCTRRDHWVHFSRKDKICMMRFGDNMGVVNGEANIFLHTWRTCKFSSTREECPRNY